MKWEAIDGVAENAKKFNHRDTEGTEKREGERRN
jgi:hypothetical protein